MQTQPPAVPANGAVPPCAVWHGGSPVSLDGAQAEKAIPGRTDEGIKLINFVKFNLVKYFE